MDMIAPDHLIRNEATLNALYGEISPGAIAKEIDYIHPHYRAMIEASPFMVLATSGPEGLDASPRGDPAGFVHVLDDKTLAFADYRGNRQYISVGNLGADDRAALILMDYPNKARLKILGRLTAHDLTQDPDLGERLRDPGYRGAIERGLLLTLEAFDWNCPQHITPRYTLAEIAPSVAPFHQRIAALEAENKALRERLGEGTGA